MFKKNVIAGLLFWVPVIVTLVSIEILFDIIRSVYDKIPIQLQFESWVGVDIPGMKILLSLGVVWLTGLLVANYLGKRVVRMGESWLNKLPLVRSVYSGVKQVLQMMIKSDTGAFTEVVLIAFPNDSSWVVGLVTQVIATTEGREALNVFVPTTPNPTSGYVITVFREDSIHLEMSVDEALKYIISLGTLSHDALNKVYSQLAEENKK